MASFFIGPIKLCSLSAQDVPGQMRKNQSLDGLGKSKHVWDFLLADQSHSNYGKSGYRREVFFFEARATCSSPRPSPSRVIKLIACGVNGPSLVPF